MMIKHFISNDFFKLLKYIKASYIKKSTLPFKTGITNWLYIYIKKKTLNTTQGEYNS